MLCAVFSNTNHQVSDFSRHQLGVQQFSSVTNCRVSVRLHRLRAQSLKSAPTLDTIHKSWVVTDTSD